MDLYLKGQLSEPVLTGTFTIDELSKNGFSMNKTPVSFEVAVKDLNRDLKAFGELRFSGGTMSGPKSATIELQKSRISFSGNPQNPSLDLKGTAVIEGTKIYLTLAGSVEKPDLQLKSVPPLSQQRLLLMLATGKSWKSAELTFEHGQISPELAKDFVDYFFFGSSGSRMAKRFGIDDIAFKYNAKTKAVEIKKNISDKLEARYGVETSQEGAAESTATYKIGGDYKLSDTISIGAQRELTQDKVNVSEEPQYKDKAILKYKKEF